MKIVKKAANILRQQNYEQPPIIEGVKLVELKRFSGDDGAFNEVVRTEEGRVVTPDQLKGFSVLQVNHSLVVPGVVKAWHLHLKQDEVWFVHPEGSLIAGLLDLREESKTKELIMRLNLGRGKASLLYIPAGVAHGLANPYPQEATMTYLVNNHFDGTDEKRLPFDFMVGKDFWEIKKG